MSRTFVGLTLLSLAVLVLSSCASALGQSATEPTAESTSVESPTETPSVGERSSSASPTSTLPPAPTVTLANTERNLVDIDPEEIVTLLPRDAIPAIWDPEGLWATVEEAEASGDIADEINLIGVAIGGEAHAYPIPFLSVHEIVNDTVGGSPIAVTW